MSDGLTLSAPKPRRRRADRAQGEVMGDLSPASIAKALFTVLAVCFGALLLFLLHEIVLLFLLGLFLATIIDPGVRKLESWGVPRSLAVVFHYVIFLGLVGFLILSLVPIMAEQVAGLASLSTAELNKFLLHPTIAVSFLPDWINRELSALLQTTLQQLSIQRLPDALQRMSGFLSSVAGSSLQMATGFATSTVGFLVDLIVVLLFAFFLEMERDRAFMWLTQFLPPAQKAYLRHKADLIYRKLSQWAKGQLILCLCIGVLVFIVLFLLRMPYALTLGVLAGVTEFVPYVGPFIAAVPGVLVAVVHGGVSFALVVAASYYAVQWSENNFIVPLVMNRAVELSPVAIIFAMLVGVSFPSILHPVLGILLSIPAASIIAIFLEDLRKQPTRERDV